ncbi:protein adenylyltransferase SelO [Janibacter alittae]|uniref:Protein nucleotidyltransferase YdiU n=1 Tax=Janibacter alittae TaxID=3115209 RepID=A0ABZ2MGN9_9MICO
MRWPFDNTYVRDLGWLGARVDPVPVRSPELLALNEDLAVELGLDSGGLRSPEGVAVLAGNALAEGSEPIAQAYAGHQFGQLTPVLGDGRAHLLGEVVDTRGRRRDLALKGSGRTPFSRAGDGRAVTGPVLREYLVAEFMHAVGVPTTRALAAVATGERVQRERPLPGAVLTRVASSHLRIGTLVLLATRGSREQLADTVEYVRARHYPDLAQHDPMALLSAVVERQARLVARWMSLGFIHGVMNTDNMTLSGETIDYGPCAFLDAYDPATFFSSVDAMGRYRYSAQPAMAMWGLARLAECLLPLAEGEPDALMTEAQERVQAFAGIHEEAWLDAFRPKLGLVRVGTEDRELVEDVLMIAKEETLDFTNLFRDLARVLRQEPTPTLDRIEDVPRWQQWRKRWLDRLESEGEPVGSRHALMDGTNPIHIPRNHLVEEALAAAHAGDLAPFAQLLEVTGSPFVEQEGRERYAEPADSDFTHGYVTYCGT